MIDILINNLMSRKIMKKAVLALMTVAAMGSMSAMANTGSVSFQWTGVVPEADETVGAFHIVQAPGSKDFQDGLLTFENKDEGAKLVAADALAFVLYKDKNTEDGAYNPAVDTEQVTVFNYALEQFKVGVNQTPQFYTGAYFDMTANGVAITTTDAAKPGSEQPVSLTVVADNTMAEDARGIKALDTVQVQAVVALSGITL